MTGKCWTADEIEILRRAYQDTPTADLAERLSMTSRRVYRKANALGLLKSDAYLASPAACRLRRGDNDAGAATRFAPGHRPHNKGRKGWHPGGRAEKTRFKAGKRNGNAVESYQPIGTERITKYGYRQRKVNDDMPVHHRWKSVHVILWEEANGPVPEGHALSFRNGDKADIRIDNLELISRRELMDRNTVHRLPQELARTIQLKGALTRQINKRTRNAK